MIYLLPHTVLESARRTPDKEAFKCGQATLTYGELAMRMQQLASRLWRLGVRRGDRVGIYLNRSIETPIALYGIMHAGAVYVPLDPKAPATRTQFQVKDCGIEVVITNPSQAKNWARTQVQGNVIGLAPPLVGRDGTQEVTPPPNGKHIPWAEVFQEPTSFTPPIRQLETDLAYIMYTSGSTGQPKGIMHTHASGLAFARLTAATFGLTAEDRFGNHAPIYFDVSTLGFFTAPLVGASTVIATDGHTIFPASMRNLIEQERLTVWYSVPLALIQLLNAGLIKEGEFPDLRWLFYAGEPFAPKYLRQLMERMPHTQVSNWYGPAETNVCTYHNLPAPPVGEAQVPIGKVWGNTDYLLFDDDDKSTEQEGELLIRSATTMAGYWGRPDLTERAFYQRTGPGSLQEAFYRTGDRARMDEHGNLHFLGRRDHQVKVRGYRVEPDAVESRLVAHPLVREAIVLALPGADEATLQLTAFVIPVQQEAALRPSAKELSTFAGEALTWYAVPEKFVFVDDFPRTGSGKVSRPELRELIRSASFDDSQNAD